MRVAHALACLFAASSCAEQDAARSQEEHALFAAGSEPFDPDTQGSAPDAVGGNGAAVFTDAAAGEHALSAMGEKTGRRWVLEVARAIEESGKTTRAASVTTAGWTWLEIDLHDQSFPLSVDILGDNDAPARGVLYMLPGGATNFRASFMVPREDSLAHFCRQRGYLVVGITPREDRVPGPERDLSFMKQWGMKQHRDDIRKVVSTVQAVVPLPHELLGHSYGAASALDYASAYPNEAQRVIVLDIYSLDPQLDPAGILSADSIYDAYVALMNQGVYADTSYYDFGMLARRGLEPSDPPGIFGLFDDPDRYTAKQLLLFGMIYSGFLPGIHTELTGLPGDWPLEQSTVAGHYFSNDDSDDDEHYFTHTRSATLRAVAQELGDGLISMAFARDYWSVVAMNGVYPLHWDRITARVVWLNSELGYGDHTYGAELLRRAGKARVELAVIPGYGHADVLWSQTARFDVWQGLFAAP